MSHVTEAETRAQAAQRVGGWSITVAGLYPCRVWACAPLPFANPAPMAGSLAPGVLTLGYAVWCFTARRRPGGLRTGQ